MPQHPEVDSQSGERTLDFEELLLEVSTLFINLPVSSIDQVIEETQRKICEGLGLDLSALWQWEDKGSNLMALTHLYSIPGGPERPASIDASKIFPWSHKTMLTGKIITISKTDEMPEDAAVDKVSRRNFGVESSIGIPLQVGGQPILGFLSFDTLNRVYHWKKQEIKRIKLVADVIANALVRKQTMLELIDSEERLCLATESADAGIWELDCATDLIWSTEPGLKMFGFEPGTRISMAQFEQYVHPEDRPMVLQQVGQAFENNEKLNIEYRVTPGHAQEIRWISSRGQPYFHDDGAPSRMLGVSIDITERKQLEEKLRKNLREIDTLKQQLEQENYYLREDLRKVQGFENVVGQSRVFNNVLLSAQQVAATPATVLLTGETGTGKGIIANTIHQLSDRSTQPFVIVNCAALPQNLVENELFGREKGAYTGAESKQAGRFEVAHRGTIFLDEIGELPLETQAKLLRVLQEGEFERLGSSRTVSVDVRIVAATARNLQDEVRKGRFREDLFYRLNVYPIVMPPLRERTDDIPLLAHYFVKKYSLRMGKTIDHIPKSMLDALVSYEWPGNIRELEHLIERSVIVSPGEALLIDEQLFSGAAGGHSKQARGLKDLASNERDHINHILELTKWKIEGPGGAAAILDIHPSTLRFRLKKLGITRPS